MKITMSEKQKKSTKTVHDLKDTIHNFLVDQGYYRYLLNNHFKRLRIDNGCVVFSPDSLNSKLTKAVGLFCLLFTEHNEYGDIDFSKEGMKVILNDSSTYDQLIQYIERHSKVSTEY